MSLLTMTKANFRQVIRTFFNNNDQGTRDGLRKAKEIDDKLLQFYKVKVFLLPSIKKSFDELMC